MMAEVMKGKIYDTVLGVIVAVCLSISGWTVKSILEHGQSIAVHGQQLTYLSTRTSDLEVHGSAPMQAQVKDLESLKASLTQDIKPRIEKLDAAVSQLTAMSGELKSISTRLEWLKEGQTRIEASFNEAQKRGKTP
jgi:chromosome segregation ATPase